MREYLVTIKDLEQNITHKVHQLAYDQTEANSIAIKILRKLLGHNKLEII